MLKTRTIKLRVDKEFETAVKRGAKAAKMNASEFIRQAFYAGAPVVSRRISRPPSNMRRIFKSLGEKVPERTVEMVRKVEL